MAEERIYRELLKGIAKVEQSYPLQQFNPLKAGGVADYFAVANDSIELASAVKAAMDVQIPYVVIGRGDGVLFSDGGFPGLVIQNLSSSFAIAADRSQIVVDSGLSLSRFITLAASRSLGGLTFLFGEPGTVGGAVYSNLGDGNYSILSSVRYLTMLMPPARLDREATIARYKVDWLDRGEEPTRLQQLKQTKSLGDYQPVILTVLLQVTSVRPDELQLRLGAESAKRPTVARGMGPIFAPVPGTDVAQLLTGAGVPSLRVDNVYPDRYHPNFISCRGASARSQSIRQLIDLMAEKVEAVYGTRLQPRYEYVGQW